MKRYNKEKRKPIYDDNSVIEEVEFLEKDFSIC